MQIKRTAVTAALVSISSLSVSAFTVPTTITTRFHPKRSFSFLQSTTLDDVTTTTTVPPALDPTGKTIAKGTIVSYFKGGLAAIQIRDDISSSNNKASTSSSGPPPMETSFNGSSQGDDLVGKQVVCENKLVGVVVAQRFPVAFVLLDNNNNNGEDAVEGTVSVLNSMASVNSVPSGSVVDCFGRSLLGETESMPPPQEEEEEEIKVRAMFAPIPQVKDIGLIQSPLLSGTTMVDALAPLGKGQNMLVIGSSMKKLRGFCCDLLQTQTRCGKTKLIYATTQDSNDVIEQFKERGVLDHVTVVACRPNENDDGVDKVSHAAEATAVAATACAMGEAHVLGGQGRDALVIVDNIDQHKVLWDATTRVMVDVFGIDAVVDADRDGGASSEMRGFYSGLVQRAGKFKPSRGDGSMTLAMLTSIPCDGESSDDVFLPSDFDQCSEKIKARLHILVDRKIPLTAANLKKIDIPIPSASEGKRRMALQHVEDLISMSDGQIWFDQGLETAGQSPPLDPQRSITRVGIGADTDSRADAPAMRRVVGGLRLDLAQALAMDGAEDTVASSRQARRRNAWLLAMHQPEGQGGRDLSESCVALLAASMGALDDTVDGGGLAGTQEGQRVMTDLLDHVRCNAATAMTDIDETLDMTQDIRDRLEDAIESFFS